MIVTLHSHISITEATSLAVSLEGEAVQFEGKTLLVVSGKIKKLPARLKDLASDFQVMDNDMQLSSKEFVEKRIVNIAGSNVGSDDKTFVMAGPCSVESKEQIDSTAAYLSSLGVQFLRGGCFKPRTSPYSFQGLGREGLELLRSAADRHGMLVVSEVRDATHVEQVIELADVIQIGAKSMYDHGILRACGKTTKPVLIKRGFGTTLQEFAQAAEFVLCGGNENVMLCERGIRTFENDTRFTLDLCGVAFLKEKTNLPIIIDPSHAMGLSYGVADLARASVAMGIDGLMVEVHCNPARAKSDAAQQLDHNSFSSLYTSLAPVAASIGRSIQ